MYEEAYAYDQRSAGPSPIFDTQLDRHSRWSETFYLSPMLLGTSYVLAGMLASIVVFRSVQGRPLILLWGVGWTMGFVGWSLAWFLFGPGTGRVDPAIAVYTAIGWIAWNAGLMTCTFPRCREAGVVICWFAAFVLVAIRMAVPEGTAFLELALIGGLLGLPHSLYVIRRCARGKNRGIAHLSEAAPSVALDAEFSSRQPMASGIGK